jgi:hypothetical protein
MRLSLASNTFDIVVSVCERGNFVGEQASLTELVEILVQLQEWCQRCRTLPPVALIVFPHHTRLSDIVCRQRRMCSSNFPRSLPAQTVLTVHTPVKHLCKTCSLIRRFCVFTNTWGLPLPDMSALPSGVSLTAPCNLLTIRREHSGHVGNKLLLCFKTACFS